MDKKDYIVVAFDVHDEVENVTCTQYLTLSRITVFTLFRQTMTTVLKQNQNIIP